MIFDSLYENNFSWIVLIQVFYNKKKIIKLTLVSLKIFIELIFKYKDST